MSPDDGCLSAVSTLARRLVVRMIDFAGRFATGEPAMVSGRGTGLHRKNSAEPVPPAQAGNPRAPQDQNQGRRQA